MSEQQPIALLGRLAIQLKMITMDQLQEATREQGRSPDRRLGDIFLEMGFLSESQLGKLNKVQRDLVIKRRAKEAASGRAVPAREQLPTARTSAPARSTAEILEPAKERIPRTAPVAPQAPEAAPIVDPPAAAEVPVAPVAQPETPAVAPPTPVAAKPPAPKPAAAAEPPRPPAAKQPVAAPPALEEDDDSLGLDLHFATDTDREQLHALLSDAVAAGASDIHLHAGAPLKLRINGTLEERGSAMEKSQTERIVSAAMTPEEHAEVRARGEIDLCCDVPGVGRFRTNVYRQQRGFDAVFRAISPEPPTLQDLGLPNALAKHTNYHQGMVLVTGPAGCGKSSTMAALVNLINEEREEHILTIEDPIEYVHKPKRCLVNQRHAGRHTSSFARALRGALREDPDVIVIGELRDLETISLAMTAAETGHFVLATLHTANAVRTINRMIGAFPSNQQGQVRTMLSESLRVVISQRLVVAKDGSGRIPALELLVINKAIGNLIRDEKTVQIRSAIQTGSSHGMCLLEQSLNELVIARKITRKEALRLAEDKKLITAS